MMSIRQTALPTLLLTALLQAATQGANVNLEPKTFENAAGEKLPYVISIPTAASEESSYPLVVFLHGAGERGSDGVLQMKHRQVLNLLTAKGSPPAIFMAPQCADGDKWSNVNWGAVKAEPLDQEPTRAMRLLLELLDSLDKDLPIDPSRRYITGLSMGGFGTFDALMRRPDYFAAAVPVCGGADDARAAMIAHVPMWVFHGAADAVVKPIRSQSIVAALKAAGGKPRYTEFPGVGHDSWSRAYAEPELPAWLFKQKAAPSSK